MQSGVVNKNTALCHHLFEVTQAQGISEIPANTLNDNISGVMQATEGFSDERHGQATSKNSMLPDDALMRQNPLLLNRSW